ncbi:MAG: site-specific DNA-methyltransferase, partial [Actinomycetota bacterium]|nr:site-specific DNA-methyltransferase [Actinomycetota bacterium]
MKDEQKTPQKILYPRDPSLDPQLVWKGKDEQDSTPLEVDAVPIYIQEKIQPKALIEELRAEQEKIEPQAALWADFNGITFEQMVEFYQHSQNWSNRLILGDSLRVMSSLADKEALKGQVQMIYVDPPYGIKFGSNWQVSMRSHEVRDGRVEDVTRQPEQIKAFRDTWELGVHSYLAYLRDRLAVAHTLLAPSGSIFVQIGPDRVHLVRSLLDEVFGAANCMTIITVQKTSQVTARFLPEVSDFLLWYARDKDLVKYRQLYEDRAADIVGEGAYRYVEQNGGRRPMSSKEIADPSLLPASARVFRYDNVTSQGFSNTKTVAFEFEGRIYHPGANRHWLLRVEGMAGLAKAGRLAVVGNTLSYIRYADESSFVRRTNVWSDTGQAGFAQRKKQYVVETNAKIPERCLLMASDPGDLVLDPTCGSGTTAVNAEKHGRRWITIDTSRVALALTRARLMAAGYHY